MVSVEPTCIRYSSSCRAFWKKLPRNTQAPSLASPDSIALPRMCSFQDSHAHTTRSLPRGHTKSAYSKKSAVIRSSRHHPEYEGKLRFHRLLQRPRETLHAAAAVGGKGSDRLLGANSSMQQEHHDIIDRRLRGQVPQTTAKNKFEQ